MRAAIVLAALVLSGLAPAQSNVVPGRDGALVDLRDLVMLGHLGTWPTGRSGISPETLVCNLGSVPIPWEQRMQSAHPFFATIVTSEVDGRLVQISSRSYVKHGANAQNGTLCGSCPGGGGAALEPGCSDIYTTGINGNNYWLGPPEEIDPWLGAWDPVCSHFDRGEPAVPPPADCDGVRSLTNAQAVQLGPIGHRITVGDAALASPASFQLQVLFLVGGEAEGLRADNLGWRAFTPTWDAGTSTWDFQLLGTMGGGSVLGAWSGAALSSATDGASDGRVYVASKVIPLGCEVRYEYALHNRDNAGGATGLRIPLAPGAVVSAVGFRDLDEDPSNDWTAAVVGNELVFSGAANPLAWNTVYNLWFEADVGPGVGAAALELASGSAPALAGLDLPLGAGTPCVSYCTPGTSASGCLASISASGVPSATAPSGFFLSAVEVEGAKNGLFFHGTGAAAANPWGNGTSLRCFAPPVSRGELLTASGLAGTCDGVVLYDQNARWTAKPSQNPGAGATVRAQLWYRDPLNTSNQPTSLSDAVEFVVGP